MAQPMSTEYVSLKPKPPEQVVSANMYKKPVELKPDPAQEPEPKLSPAKEKLVSELRKLQTHDPDVIPMQGGGYGKIIKDARGRFQSIQPMSQPQGASNTALEQAVAEATLEDLQVNTLGLLRRVALNPTVTLGYAYVTSTLDPKSGDLYFKGDLADWINWCVERWLLFAFGVKFGVFTGAPSLKDMIQGEDN